MNPIIYGDDTIMAELTYGGRSDGLIQELRNNLSTMNPLLTEQGKIYAQRAAQVFEAVSGWDAVRAVRKAVQAVTGYIRSDAIGVFGSLELLQTAPPRMQRFIMAIPEVRKLYIDGRVDGYSETYADIQPGVWGRDHYDYRVATHGVVQTTSVGDNIQYEITQYKMDLASWDEPLSQRQTVDLARTWAVAKALLIEGEEEPTNRFGGKL